MTGAHPIDPQGGVVGSDDATAILDRSLGPSTENEPQTPPAQGPRPTPQPQPKDPPLTNLGRFLILRLLGRGGMGAVYLAYDPDLDRRVAIKLVHSRDRYSEERLLREAQALARLDHPNVVKVHDVGRWREQIFVAMDHVDGETLREWLRRERHPWRAIVAVFVQAGRGLEAAHAAGLIHRDFKPRNVLIPHRDQEKFPRVQVIDFGLAKSVGATDEAETRSSAEAAAGDALSSSHANSNSHANSHANQNSNSNQNSGLGLGRELTQVGARIGTPAYMAPEQHRGDPADARSDQFAFCVALYEGLWGRRPFPGATLSEIRRAVLDPSVAPTAPEPSGAGLPRRISRRLWTILRRGLRRDPEARWPAIGELLAALEGLLEDRRPAGFALGLAGLALAGGGALMALPESEPCDFQRSVAAVWDDARRATLHHHFAATAMPWADDAAVTVSRELDAWTQRWAHGRTELCHAIRDRGETDPETAARQRTCYSNRLAELEALITLFVDPAAGGRRLASSAKLLGELPDLGLCRDPARLRAGAVASSATAEEAAALAGARAELASLRYLRAAGEYDAVRAGLTTLRPQVSALGDRALAAELRHFEGRMHALNAGYPEARAAYEEALIHALTIARDDLAIAILISLSHLGADEQVDPEAARHTLDLAQALLERHPEYSQTLAADIAYFRATHEFRAGRPGAAQALAERALGLREGLLPGDHADVIDSQVILGVLASARGDHEVAQGLFERALAQTQARWGPGSPPTLDIHNNLAIALIHRGDTPAAIEHMRLATTHRTQLLGASHPDVLVEQVNLAGMLSSSGHADEADELFAAASLLAVDAFGPGSTYHVDLLAMRASHRLRQGQRSPGIADFRQAIARLEAIPDHDEVWAAELRCRLGELVLEDGEVAEAIALLETCEPILRADGPPLLRGYAQRSLADALAARGDLENPPRIAALRQAALESFERAAAAGDAVAQKLLGDGGDGDRGEK